MEEFLLKNYRENIFMLWQSQECVVVGKHQNTLAEINYPYVEERGIPVARRLSGGGTVYHDMGNVNFSFMINGSEGKLVDFRRHTSIIVSFLNKLGVPAQSNQRHDIAINGLKISGNAEHIFKKRVLHHGTLLFNTNLERLEKSIMPVPGKYSDKAVQSVRSKVTNIYPYLHEPMETSKFKDLLMEHVLNQFTGSQTHLLNSSEMQVVDKLADEKYKSWDWIFGYSPLYALSNRFKTKEFEIDIQLVIKKGVIIKSEIIGKNLDLQVIAEINQTLTGLKHHKEIILVSLQKELSYFRNKNNLLKEFVKHLF